MLLPSVKWVFTTDASYERVSQKWHTRRLHAGNMCVSLSSCFHSVWASLQEQLRQRNFIKDASVITHCESKYCQLGCLQFFTRLNLTVFMLWFLSLHSQSHPFKWFKVLVWNYKKIVKQVYCLIYSSPFSLAACAWQYKKFKIPSIIQKLYYLQSAEDQTEWQEKLLNTRRIVGKLVWLIVKLYLLFRCDLSTNGE